MRPTPKSAAKKAQKGAGAAPAKYFPFAAVALFALVIGAYGNSLSNGFVWDDHRQIVMNPAVQAAAPLTPLVTTDARFPNFDSANQTTVYRPLQMLTYRGVVGLFGASALAFHVCSVAFALAGALAGLWLFWLLTRSLPTAFAAAALFAVYPVHTEAVDWIAALPDLGCGLFFLLAFALYVVRRKPLSLAAFAVALLWKETAVVFPLLLVVYLLLQPSATRVRDCLKGSAWYWAILAVYLGVRAYVLGSIAHSPRTWLLGPLQFVLTVAHLTLSYWVKLAVPVGLSAYYLLHPVRSIADPRVPLTVLLVGCVAAGVYLLRRTWLALFAIAWVILALLPALDLNALGRNAFTERYLYLPSAGFCLLVALGAAWLVGRLPAKLRRPVAAVALAAVVAAFTAETVTRNPDWKDDMSLFTATLPFAMDSPFVHVMVASLQSDEASEASFAEHNYLQAIELATQETPPDRLDAVAAYQGLASLYSDRGEFDQALAEMAQARALAPNNPDADGEEGIILAHAGRGKEAEPLLERAREQQPHNENILSALGLVARDDLHDLPRAASLFSEVLAVHTEADEFNASAHNNLGAVYGDQDNYGAAIEQFRLATQIAPDDPEFRMNLATSLAANGRISEARAQAQIAVQLAPHDGGANDLLARLQAANP
jgi:Flp pilus assembly protein TadD